MEYTKRNDGIHVVRHGIRLAAMLLLAIMLSAPVKAAVATINTESLSAQLSAIGKLSVPANLTLTTAGTTFQVFSGSMTLSYRARTTPTGSGSITVKANADFAPAGGPSIASASLTYTCASATLGTVCSGTQTVSTTSQTSVTTIPASACTGGGGSCSAINPNTEQLSFALTNSPTFQTGTYSASLTFTISAV